MKPLRQINFGCGRWPRAFSLIVGATIFASGLAYSQIPSVLTRPTAKPSPSPSRQPEATPTVSTAPPTELSIPVPEVADRLNNLDRLLRKINSRLVDEQNAATNIDELKDTGKSLAERSSQLQSTLAGTSTLEELKEMHSVWQTFDTGLREQSAIITQKLKLLEDDIARLQNEQKLWELTLTQYRQIVGADIVIVRINNALAEIKKNLDLTRQLRETNLVVQNLIAEQSLVVSDALDSLTNAEAKYGNQLLIPDRRPLWTTLSSSHPDSSFIGQISEGMSKQMSSAWAQLKRERSSLLRIVLLFGLVSGIFIIVGRKTAQNKSGQAGYTDASIFYRHPVRVSIIAATTSLFWLPLLTSPFLRNLVISLLFILFLLLITPLIQPAFRPLLYLLTAIYILQRIWALFATVPLLERLTSIFVLATVLTAGVWIMRPSRLKKFPEASQAPKIVISGIWIMLAILSISLIANLFGYFTLSKLLSNGVSRSVFSGIRLYVWWYLGGILLSMVLQARWAQSLTSIRQSGDVFYKWVSRIFAGLALIIWVLTTLDSLGLRDKVVKGLIAIFVRDIDIGQLSFNLWDVSAFVIVLLMAFAVTKTVKFFLQEDVLPRMSLQRGLSNAILTIIQYSLLLCGFLLALGAIGVNLDRFTFLAGAFGVGVGFGLQNIFNNFASGLIILFERPVNIDDIVEIGGVSGQVKHIGIRASTIRTAQGADVFVPNSTLVSNQVTNWTYSDLTRRQELKVGVAYGTEPEKVIELLTTVAKRVKGVEKYPEPVVLFRGFGESSLNFELRYWVLHLQNVEIESEIGIAAVAALRDAGIEIPFPQRDLHLRSLAEGIKNKLNEDNKQSFEEGSAKHAK